MTYEEERALHPEPVVLPIKTRVPSKWMIIDRETGLAWEFREGSWQRVNRCSRCSALHGLEVFEGCRTCGAVTLCPSCTDLHLAEIAGGEL